MAVVCPRCVEGVPLSGEPTGSISAEFQGAYFAPAPELGGEPSKFTVLLLTDAFGMEVQSCKLIADDLAKKLGCDVWIPDYFNGRPLIPADKMELPDRAGVKITTWDWIRLLFTVIIPRIPIFISNRPTKADGRVESLINLIKEKKKYEKIGTVGYCFGGSTCVRLGGTDLVDSIVIAHPGTVTLDQVNAIKVPASWVCAEDDAFFADKHRDQCEAALAGRKDKANFVEYEFKVYKGTAHGFASRPNLDLPEIKEAYEGAFEQTVEWFKKTIAC